MKKALIYLFLPLILLNGCVCELLKAPMLVSHYLTHRTLNHVGIMQFISMHYLGNDIDDNDDAEDNRLPFKKADCNTFIQFNVPLTQSVIALKKPWYAVVQHNSYRLSFEVCNAPIDPSFKPPQA